MTRPFRHQVPIEVRYAETDQMGVVHHANYLIWFELARTALCAQGEYSYARIENELGVWLMVIGAHVKYRGAARYGDNLAVASWIERLKSRAVHFGYQVLRDGEVLVSGTTEHVWVDRATQRPCRMPGVLAESFEKLAGAEAPTTTRGLRRGRPEGLS